MNKPYDKLAKRAEMVRSTPDVLGNLPTNGIEQRTKKKIEQMTSYTQAEEQAIIAAADKLAASIWTVIDSTHTTALNIAELCQAAKEDYTRAGTQAIDSWGKMGGGVCNSQTTRHFVEACHGTNMTKKAASAFLNAMGIVSKQRVSQLLAVVYDGDNSKNKGITKGTVKDTSKESQDRLDKSAGNGFTVAQIMAAIQSLQSITLTEAESLAAVIASKVA